MSAWNLSSGSSSTNSHMVLWWPKVSIISVSRWSLWHFPSTEAAVKLLWLAICNIEDKRAAERARDRGKPAGERKAQGRLVEGQVVTNWKQALAQLAAAYPDRINPYL